MKYIHVVAEFYSRVWAMRYETLCAMRTLLALQAEGIKWSDEEIAQRIAAANKQSGYEAKDRTDLQYLTIDPSFEFIAGDFDKNEPPRLQARRGGSNGASSPGSVALIPMTGIISHRMNLMGDISGPGGCSVQKLTAQFREALGDGNCKAIVFDVDSPGGSIDGVPELASEIYNARKQKPITAVANSMAASAAYWLCSAAGECVITPSGQAGSIGVYLAHQDESEALKQHGVKISLISAGKYKTEGNPAEPLGDEARAALQQKVDDYYSLFVKDVARNRGATQARVRSGFGQGRLLLAQDAVKEGLIDRAATLDDVLAGFGVKSGANSEPRSAAPGRSASASVSAGAEYPDKQPNDDDDEFCECECDACKGCTGMKSAKAANAGRLEKLHARTSAEDDMNCACACNACKACDFKPGAKKSAKAAATDPVGADAVTAAGGWLDRRRRQLALLS